MGRSDKKPLLIEWLKHIHQDCSVVTRQFLTIKEFYDIYKSSKNEDEKFETITSFKRLIDAIVRLGLYKNLKSKVFPRTKFNINQRTKVVLHTCIHCST